MLRLENGSCVHVQYKYYYSTGSTSYILVLKLYACYYVVSMGVQVLVLHYSTSPRLEARRTKY
jgi:hypothetical protein